MIKRDYVIRQMDAGRTEWFKDHRAQCLAVTTDFRVIEWRNPQSWVYGVRFIMHRRWLVVVGDIGEAVYEWSEDISPEFLRGLDFDYFRSKCRASESGQDFNLFDAGEGKAALLTEVACSAKEDPKWADVLYKLSSKIGSCSCIDEWKEAVRYYYDMGDLDAEAASRAYDLSVFPHPRQIGHFVGLQLALGQLA